MTKSEVIELLSGPPTSARGQSSYIALTLKASAADVAALRVRCRLCPIAVIYRDHSLNLIAILAEPIPVERALMLRDRLASWAALPVTASAPCRVSSEPAWVRPRLTEYDMRRVMLAIAGTVDLDALTIGTDQPWPRPGVVETRHGGYFYAGGRTA